MITLGSDNASDESSEVGTRRERSTKRGHDLLVGAGVVVLAKGRDLFPDHRVEPAGRRSLSPALDLTLKKRRRAAHTEESGEQKESAPEAQAKKNNPYENLLVLKRIEI